MSESVLLPPSPSGSPPPQAEVKENSSRSPQAAVKENSSRSPQAAVQASFLPPATPALRTYPDVVPARPQKAATNTKQAARWTATRIDWGICLALMFIAA